MSVYKAKVRGETKWVASSPHKSGDRRRWHRIYATKKQALSWWRRQEDEDAIPPDRRRLSELVHIYLQAQSANLKGSERPRAGIGPANSGTRRPYCQRSARHRF